MTPRDLLLAAADLLETAGWTRGWYARNARGAEVDPNDPTACAYCVSGALQKFNAPQHVFDEAEQTLCDLLGTSFYAGWNDVPGRTREQVTTALRQAAASLEEN